jgi:hypothetical protein
MKGKKKANQINEDIDTFTTAGSQTKFAKESAIPPVLISTPYGAPSPVKKVYYF